VSRPSGRVRNMDTPTIADLRGAVSEAGRHCLDAEQAEVEAAQHEAACRRSVRRAAVIGGVQVVLLIAQGVLFVVAR
jgi:hypothetical protein